MRLWWQVTAHSGITVGGKATEPIVLILFFSLLREAFYENLSLLKVDKISHFEI